MEKKPSRGYATPFMTWKGDWFGRRGGARRRPIGTTSPRVLPGVNGSRVGLAYWDMAAPRYGWRVVRVAPGTVSREASTLAITIDGRDCWHEVRKLLKMCISDPSMWRPRGRLRFLQHRTSPA